MGAGRSSHAWWRRKSPAACLDVHFRVFPEGDVIALFSNDPADGGLIHSYQRGGPRWPATPRLLKMLRKATPKEYAPLLRELRRVGYCLVVKS